MSFRRASPKEGGEIFFRHELVQPLAMDRQPGFVGGVKALPEILEFEVAGDPYVHAELLLGPEFVEQVLSLVEGRGQVAGLEGADDVAGDAWDLQAGLIDLLTGIASPVHGNRAVPEAVDLLVEALAHDPGSTISVKVLCKTLTGSCVPGKGL